MLRLRRFRPVDERRGPGRVDPIARSPLSACDLGTTQPPPLARVRVISWLRRRYPLVQVASGLVLVAMGGLVLSGELFRLNIEAQRALSELGLNFWRSL